jgi:hypothetical protein
MRRIDALKALCAEYHWSKLAKRISPAQMNRVEDFIKSHDALDHINFEYAVNRWMLNDSVKPKEIFIMHEFAMVSNSRALGKVRSRA